MTKRKSVKVREPQVDDPRADSDYPEKPDIEYSFDVSVVICTYQTPKSRLEKVVKSALSQDVSVQVVIVDDGGGLDYEADAPNIFLLRHDTNKGIAAAANTGVDAALGEFIFVLGDDPLEPNCLGKMVAAARKAKGKAYIYGDVKVAGGVHYTPNKWKRHEPGDRLQTSGGILFPKSVFPKCRFHQPLDMEFYFLDYDFILQLEAMGLKGVKVDGVVFHHVPTKGGHSQSARKDDAKIRERLWERYGEFKGQ